MTNGMLIQTMDNDQLAYFLACRVPYDLFFTQGNVEGVREWLNQENDHIYHFKKVII